MADYSANATQLSGPQAQGAGVVQPSEQKVVPQTAIFETVGSIVDVFAKGLTNQRKEEAEQRKNAIVGQYIKDQTLINDAISQGAIDPAAAAARSRASANKYLASYPEYFQEFESAGKALKGITEAGETEDKLKLQRDLYKERISRAQQQGYAVDMSMPKNVIDSQLDAYDTTVRIQNELTRQYQRNAENRAQNAEDRTVRQEELRRNSIVGINTIAGAKLESTSVLLTELTSQVKSGKLDPMAAQQQLIYNLSQTEGAIQAMASTMPELAAPYRSLFDDMRTLGIKALDPKAANENLEDQIKMLINRQKLMIVSEPKNAGIVAASELLGANATIALAAGETIVKDITKMITNTVDGGGITPQVVGDPDKQKDVFKATKQMISRLDTPAYKDQAKATGESVNLINNILKQVGNDTGKSLDAKGLKDAAEFFASPEYGGFAVKGLQDKGTAQAAKKVFQLNYEPVVINGIQQKLESTIKRIPVAGVMPAEHKLSEAIDVEFTGSGVVFKPKQASIDRMSDMERQFLQQSQKELVTAQTAVNQLIRIGAHLEGTTDYKKFWEEHRHEWLPQVYAAPSVIKVGQVVNGYEFYKDGDPNDPRNWRPKAK